MRIEGMWALRLRRWLVGVLTGQRTDNVNISAHVFIQGFERLELGHNVDLNRDCHLTCQGGVKIGNFVAIGHATSIISTNHGYADRDVPMVNQPTDYAPVTIGDNVWIGARVTILAGVRIESGTVVAAGSVVTRTVDEPDTIIGGVPARRIKSRFEGAPSGAGLRNAR
jgi:acetyltransferase-like isoleucine patch superfamily enzyme